MAGMMAETYMLQAISNGLSVVRGNTALLADILDALNANELQAAQTYFGDATKQIIIAPGFPMNPSQLPFIGVTIASESMLPREIGIGYAYDRIDNGNGTFTDVLGARFSGQLKATIYTPDASLVVWLSAVCKWCLLSNLGWFDSTAGINNVQITVGDYEPSPEFLPTFTFARGVFLNGEYDSTFTVTPTGAKTWTLNPNYSALDN